MMSRNRFGMIRLSLLVVVSTLLLAATTTASDFDAVEAATRASFTTTTIDLTICVRDEDSGATIPWSSLTLLSWSEGLESLTADITSTNEGCFAFNGIFRGPAQIKVEAPDYYPSITPIDLHVPSSITSIDLDDIALTKKRDGVARLVFGGDVMFERRFFDKGILTLGDTLKADTERLFQYIRPFLESGDHTNVNLECPFVGEEDRTTPHPNKKIVFGCYPESAEALPWVGIDSVTIANNHLYDYLEIGTLETMDILDQVGMTWFGGGMTRQQARDSLHRFDISGTGSDPISLSFQGFTNYFDYIQGDQYTTFADFEPVVKGGAMPAFIGELKDFSESETQAGRISIPIIHGGSEYTLKQDNGMRSDFQTSAMAGAKLIIAHHPHVVHGISTFQSPGDADPIFVVGSLGNLVFDQDIHETFQSYLAVVDMNKAGKVERLELVPFILEDYVPRPVTINADKTSKSSAVARAVRRIAHLSTAEALNGVKASIECSPSPGASAWVKQSGCGFAGAVPYLDGGKILVVASESELKAVDTVTTHVATLSSTGTPSQILAVHDHHSEESSLKSLEVTSASSSASISCELGVDLLRVGGFETETSGGYGPDDYPLPSLWETSKYRFIQSTRTRTGTGAAVLLRQSTNKSRTSIYYDRRVDVASGSKVTVRGFFAMENAGKFVVAVYFTDSNKVVRYEKGSSFTHPGGNIPDWSEFNVNLNIPSDVVKIKVYIRQSPPEQGGEGRVFVDDVSFIQWDAHTVPLKSVGPVNLMTPNGWEFVRCNHVGSDDLNVDMDVTGRTYESGKRRDGSNRRNLRQTQ